MYINFEEILRSYNSRISINSYMNNQLYTVTLDCGESKKFNSICFGTATQWLDYSALSLQPITIKVSFPSRIRTIESFSNKFELSFEDIELYYYKLLYNLDPTIFDYVKQTERAQYTIKTTKNSALRLITPIRSLYEYYPFWIVSYFISKQYPDATTRELLVLPFIGSCFRIVASHCLVPTRNYWGLYENSFSLKEKARITKQRIRSSKLYTKTNSPQGYYFSDSIFSVFSNFDFLEEYFNV